MAKSDALQEHLRSVRPDRVVLDFDDVGRLVGGLPPSADQHRAWWANTRSHTNAVAWLDAGWVVEGVDFGGRRVTFRRSSEVSTTPPEARPSRRPQLTTARTATLATRISEVIGEFPDLLDYYDHALPFDKSGQYAHHRRTIEQRFEAGSVRAALANEGFLRSLYATLQAWGIGSRASKLIPFPEFGAELRRWTGALEEIDGLCIDAPALDVEATGRTLWLLVDGMEIVKNQARIVALSKTLHHLLPDLLPPIDRMYTQRFFGFHSPEFQYGQEKVFKKVWRHFTSIASAVDLSSYVGPGWRTSRSKVIDNAIVAYVHQERPNRE
jgi:hypothetical protein